MGIVKKQVYKNTIISYLGIAIGYLNMIMLYPRFLTTEEIGLFQLLISIAIFYSLLSTMGVPGIIVRFFPYYKTEDKLHSGFIQWAGLFSLAGFLLCTVLFFVFKPIITASYIKNSSLFISYYYYVIPLGFFTVFFNFFEAMGKIIYQTIYSSFLRDVLLRLLTTVAVLMYAKNWITFDEFVLIYIIFNGIISLMLFIYIGYSDKFSFRLPFNRFAEIKHKEVINYGFFTLLTGIVYVLLQKIDILMLSSIVSLSVQGVYSVFFSVALVINVPSQALSRTTYQLVANSWKENDMNNVKNIYYKTSIIQMVIGGLLFVGVLINKNNLLAILKNPEFGLQFNVFVLIGLSFLIDITGGLNLHIISVSNKYKLITVVAVIASICCILLNYFFIPTLGGTGAALAYLLTVIGINFYNWLYIHRNFDMQPFNIKHLIVIFIIILCYFIGTWLWKESNIYIDIIIRSSVVSILFSSLIYVFKISPDINEKINRTLIRLKEIIS